MEDLEPLEHQLLNLAWDLLIMMANADISLMRIDPFGCLAEVFLASVGLHDGDPRRPATLGGKIHPFQLDG